MIGNYIDNKQLSRVPLALKSALSAAPVFHEIFFAHSIKQWFQSDTFFWSEYVLAAFILL